MATNWTVALDTTGREHGGNNVGATGDSTRTGPSPGSEARGAGWLVV
jgi:hypothetical protein